MWWCSSHCSYTASTATTASGCPGRSSTCTRLATGSSLSRASYSSTHVSIVSCMIVTCLLLFGSFGFYCLYVYARRYFASARVQGALRGLQEEPQAQESVRSHTAQLDNASQHEHEHEHEHVKRNHKLRLRANSSLLDISINPCSYSFLLTFSLLESNYCIYI